MSQTRRTVRVRRPALLRELPPEVAVLSAVSFCVALGFGIVAPVIPVFARTFEVSALQASMVVSAFALARLVTSPLSGALVDRLGERVVLATGLSIVAISSAAAGLSQSFVQLIALRAAGGLGSSMFTVSAMALLIRVVDARHRGRAAGAYQSGFLFGGIAGPAVGGIVVAWSIRAPFFVYAATLTAAALVAALMLRKATLHEREEKAAPGESGKLERLREALQQYPYRAALTVNFVSGFLFYGMRSSAVPLFVTEGLHRGASFVGFGFLASAAVQAVLLLPAGRITDTKGRRITMRAGTTAMVVSTLGLSIADIASNGVSVATTLGTALFLASMVVQGFAAGFLGSAPAAVVGDVVGGRRGGITVAAFQMMSDLGGVLGPLVVGMAIDLWDFDVAFGVGSVLSLIAVIVVWFMPETLRRTPEAPAPAPEESST